VKFVFLSSVFMIGLIGLFVFAQSLEDSAKAGEAVYQTSCMACHQANGQGVPGAFPPLVEHSVTILTKEGGRDYLPKLILYGLMGQVSIKGQSYNGVMTPWAQLTDEQLADVLNYVLTSWGNADLLPEDFTPYTPDEVAAQRGLGLTSAQMLEEHKKLGLSDAE
jgi:mono/diheme cytochrome c family protein